MIKKVLYLVMLVSVVSFSASCNKDDNTDSTFDLSISGLEDLGSGYVYEGWLIVDGSPVSTGTFTVDNAGSLSKSSFKVAKDDLAGAATFVLTIEPSPDSDSAPSNVHILSGDFSGNVADLTVSHGASLNNSFATAAGKYILATPSDDVDSDEKSGIWFLDNSTGQAVAGLNLPTLPDGWIYEGWAVINGTPVSTGTFSATDVADNSAPYSGTNGTPGFPGEDFLMGAPNGLSFPTDLSGGVAVISIEPVPDNSTGPFVLKPLVGTIDASSSAHTVYEMGQNLAFPTGMVTR